MVPLVALAQDGNGVVHRRCVHAHGLEAALQSCVLLNLAPVLIRGGGAHRPQFPARQHGLRQVGGVHAAP